MSFPEAHRAPFSPSSTLPDRQIHNQHPPILSPAFLYSPCLNSTQRRLLTEARRQESSVSSVWPCVIVFFYRQRRIVPSLREPSTASQESRSFGIVLHCLLHSISCSYSSYSYCSFSIIAFLFNSSRYLSSLSSTAGWWLSIERLLLGWCNTGLSVHHHLMHLLY